MMPSLYRVTQRKEETPDTATLALVPAGPPLAPAQPGQFHMLYAFGVGEAPISISGTRGTDTQLHTLRAVGAVTRALHGARPATMVGLRGPFGHGWRLPPEGADLVIVGGGIGLAPLRPVVRHAVANGHLYRRVSVLIGARTPGDLLYADEYAAWRGVGVTVESTVDRASTEWDGRVGVVTTLLPGIGCGATEAPRGTLFSPVRGQPRRQPRLRPDRPADLAEPGGDRR